MRGGEEERVYLITGGEESGVGTRHATAWRIHVMANAIANSLLLEKYIKNYKTFLAGESKVGM